MRTHTNPTWESTECMAKELDVAPGLAREVVYINDDCGGRSETDAERWKRVRKWAADQLLSEGGAS